MFVNNGFTMSLEDRQRLTVYHYPYEVIDAGRHVRYIANQLLTAQTAQVGLSKASVDDVWIDWLDSSDYKDTIEWLKEWQVSRAKEGFSLTDLPRWNKTYDSFSGLYQFKNVMQCLISNHKRLTPNILEKCQEAAKQAQLHYLGSFEKMAEKPENHPVHLLDVYKRAALVSVFLTKDNGREISGMHRLLMEVLLKREWQADYIYRLIDEANEIQDQLTYECQEFLDPSIVDNAY